MENSQRVAGGSERRVAILTNAVPILRFQRLLHICDFALNRVQIFFLLFVFPDFRLAFGLRSSTVVGELADIVNLRCVLRDSLRVVWIGESLCEIEEFGRP